MRTYELDYADFDVPMTNEKYRAVVIDTSYSVSTDGIHFLSLDFVVMGSISRNSFAFREELVNDVSNPRSQEFFKFLADANIQFDNFDELVGLTFDADIVFEAHNYKTYRIFANRKLVERPLMAA